MLEQIRQKYGRNIVKRSNCSFFLCIERYMLNSTGWGGVHYRVGEAK